MTISQPSHQQNADGHDHHHHEHLTPGTAKDPVCGMQVNAEVATASGLTAEHEGSTYYFCCAHCRSAFLAEPARFLAQA